MLIWDTDGTPTGLQRHANDGRKLIFNKKNEILTIATEGCSLFQLSGLIIGLSIIIIKYTERRAVRILLWKLLMNYEDIGPARCFA